MKTDLINTELYTNGQWNIHAIQGIPIIKSRWKSDFRKNWNLTVAKEHKEITTYVEHYRENH